MLYDARSFKKIYIAYGRTDMRRGINGFAMLIQHSFQLNPFEKDVLYLFCGNSSKMIKGLLWEGDGFLLLQKRLESGRFQWPRTSQEVKEITAEQLELLLRGFTIVTTINEVSPKRAY